MELRRTTNGAVAGLAGAAVWAAQQPLDKRLFRSGYDDVELLGRLVRRGESWQLPGLALHLGNGAVFGALFSLARPLFPGPAPFAGPAAGLAEHLAFWPLVRVTDRYHPARDELVKLSGNRAAFAQAAWRHLLFGLVLGELERRLNPGAQRARPEEVPVASNGHGNIEHAAVGATEGS